MSVLRRHRILEDDVRRVIAHLKAHKKITDNDILNRPRLKTKKGLGPNEEIPWAHAELAGSWQQKDLKAGPNNSAVLYAKEHGIWKLVVPEEGVQKFLRKSLLDPSSRMPMGRDSAYHHVQKGTVGISRRSMYAFLEKQGVLQITKNIPNEQGKGGEDIEKRGICEMDLIEGKGRDLYAPRGLVLALARRPFNGLRSHRNHQIEDLQEGGGKAPRAAQRDGVQAGRQSDAH